MAGPLSNVVCSPLLAKLLGTRLRAILFSCFVYVRTSRGHPTRVCRGSVTFVEDFGAAAPFFSIKQIPRLGRSLAGESRTGRCRRRWSIISQKL